MAVGLLEYFLLFCGHFCPHCLPQMLGSFPKKDKYNPEEEKRPKLANGAPRITESWSKRD